MSQRSGMLSDGDRIHKNKPSAGLDVRNRKRISAVCTVHPDLVLRPLVYAFFILTPLANLQLFFFIYAPSFSV
jgi:hypothetical protein